MLKNVIGIAQTMSAIVIQTKSNEQQWQITSLDVFTDSNLLQCVREKCYVYDGEHVKQLQFTGNELNKENSDAKLIAIDPNMKYPFVTWSRINKYVMRGKDRLSSQYKLLNY